MPKSKKIIKKERKENLKEFKSIEKEGNVSTSIQEIKTPSIYAIKESDVLGRYLASTRYIEAGEIVIEKEKPLVIGPVQQSKPLCLGCYTSIDDINKFRCEKCSWPICQSSCTGLYKDYGHTLEECLTLSKTSFDSEFQHDHENIYNFIVPLRCLLLKNISKEKWKILTSMESHNKIRKEIKNIWEINEKTVVNKLQKYFNTEEIHTICGVLEVNCFEVTKNDISLRALFPLSCLMSHNCVQNTTHTNDDKFKLQIRASIPIRKDQPITVNYAYALQGTAKRRAHIKETKFFDCTCDRCSDSSELGSNLSTVVCPKCNHPTLMSSAPLNQHASWICNYKRCTRNSVCHSYVDNLVMKFQEELKIIPENDIVSYENWIKKALISFHENHYLIVGVKYTLCLLYGKIPGFMIQEMNDDLLRRKINICEELLKIADVLEPGLSRLRGIILYELHAPKMMVLSRKYEKQVTSKKQLKYSLLRIIFYLKEASNILKFEDENTMEGKLAYAANQALLETHRWEKIIGKL